MVIFRRYILILKYPSGTEKNKEKIRKVTRRIVLTFYL